MQKKQCELAIKEAVLDAKGEFQTQITSMLEKHQATTDEYQATINKLRDANEAALAKQQADFEAKLRALEKQMQQKPDDK